HELIRLQCYEGLDEAKALYEWEYAKQLLYTQILKDKIGEVIAGTKSLKEAVDRITTQDDVFFSERFILPRPLLRAISSERPSVLLIDEIDKADTEFEAFLLEVLSDFQVSVPELGTLRARHVPLVVLTSNIAPLDHALVDDTLSTILKYEGDIRKSQQELKDHVARQKAKLAVPPAADARKDVLH